jgi:hypothetical protein
VPEQGTGPSETAGAGLVTQDVNRKVGTVTVARIGAKAIRQQPDSAHQLSFADQNHPTVQARQRAVAAAVIAGTYRGRDGRSHPFQARHRELMWWMCACANGRGEVLPKVMTLGRLAAELGRDKDNVNRDVRQLEAAGLLYRRALPGSPGPLYVYCIPGMQQPLRSVE